MNRADVRYRREAEAPSTPSGPTGRRSPVWREDMIAAGASSTLIAGLFLDGWNHINLQNGALGGFFTPWHGLLYAGFTASAFWVMTRNAHLYVPNRAAKPQLHRIGGIPMRYPFAMIGIGIASVGVVGDAIWHTLFGEEVGVARVIAPFHLMLFSGAALLIAAPLRSAWHAHDHYPSRGSVTELLPLLLGLGLLTAAIAFMFQWLSAFVDWSPSLVLGRLPAVTPADARVLGTAEFAGVAKVLTTNVVLLVPVLLALRRWQLPFGSVTIVWTFVAAAMSALTSFDLWGTVLAASIGGVVADVLLGRLRPSPARPMAYRAAGGLIPFALWPAHFAALRVMHGITWPTDLMLGTVGVTCLIGAALTFLAAPPYAPSSFTEAPVSLDAAMLSAGADAWT